MDKVSKDTKVEPSVTLNISGAVRDGAVEIHILEVGHWMDAASGRNKMRTGFKAVPFGDLVVAIPLEGIKEGQILTKEELAQFLANGLSSLFPAVNVFVEESQNDF